MAEIIILNCAEVGCDQPIAQGRVYILFLIVLLLCDTVTCDYNLFFDGVVR